MIKIKMKTLLDNIFFLTLYYLAINFHNYFDHSLFKVSKSIKKNDVSVKNLGKERKYWQNSEIYEGHLRT